MAGIEELVGGDQKPRQNTFNALVAATVKSRDGDEVTMVVPSFTTGQSYDSVPYFKSGSAEPGDGDKGFLLFDDGGHPAVALVFT